MRHWVRLLLLAVLLNWIVGAVLAVAGPWLQKGRYFLSVENLEDDKFLCASWHDTVGFRHQFVNVLAGHPSNVSNVDAAPRPRWIQDTRRDLGACTMREVGWPLLSLEARRDYRGASVSDNGAFIPQSRLTGGQSIWIPLVPKPLGLLANSAVYMPCLWLGGRLVRAYVRKRRVRAGECPVCRYTMTGSPHAARCPECGGSPTA